MEDGIRAWRASGAEIRLSHFYILLVTTNSALGRTNTAQAMLDKAEDIIRKQNEVYYGSELYRLKAELRAIKGDYGDASVFIE